MRHFTGIWIWILGIVCFTKGQDLTDSREAVVCSDSKDSETIGCRNGPMYIKSATVYTLNSWQFCELSDIQPQLGNVPSGCLLNAKGIYEACHGVQECTLTREMTETVLGSGQCSNGDSTNVLYVTYSCYNMSSTSATLLPAQAPVIAKSFDIFSPVYPCNMPGEDRSMECVITKNSTVAPTTFSALVEIVRLRFGTSNRCWENLHLDTTGAKKDLTRNYCGGEVRDMWKTTHVMSSVTSLTITYNSKVDPTQDAGTFWIKVKSASVGNGAVYRMSCSANPESNITVSQTSTCRPFKETLRSLRKPPVVLNEADSEDIDDDNDKNGTSGSAKDPEGETTILGMDSGTATEYAIVGIAIIVFVVILVIITCCICCRSSEEKTTKHVIEDETSMTNVHSANGGATVVTTNNEIRRKKAKKEKTSKTKTKESQNDKKSKKKTKEDRDDKQYLKPKKEAESNNNRSYTHLHSSVRTSNGHDDEIKRASEVGEDETPYRPVSYASNTESPRDSSRNSNRDSNRDSYRNSNRDSFTDSFRESNFDENTRDSEVSRSNIPSVIVTPIPHPTNSNRGSMADYQNVREESEIAGPVTNSVIQDDISRSTTPTGMSAPVAPPPPPVPGDGKMPAYENVDIIDATRSNTSSGAAGSTLERPESSRYGDADDLNEIRASSRVSVGDDYLAPSSIAESESRREGDGDSNVLYSNVDRNSRYRGESSVRFEDDISEPVSQEGIEKRYSDGLY